MRQYLSEAELDIKQLGWASVQLDGGLVNVMDKAGAYGVQGCAAHRICEIAGSYSGVMGLPLFETVELLHAAGFDLPFDR